MSFSYINVETIKNKYIYFFKSGKITSPANEFLLHKCRNKNEKIIFFFKTENNYKSS